VLLLGDHLIELTGEVTFEYYNRQTLEIKVFSRNVLDDFLRNHLNAGKSCTPLLKGQ